MFVFYRWIYNLMGFSRSQANGFLIFLPILAIITFSEPIYRAYFFYRIPDRSADSRKLDSLIAVWPKPSVQVSQISRQTIRPKVVDPNTASMTELVAIGLPERLAGRIISYRKKGGSFNSIGDLKKIYGMDSSILTNIKAFVTFPHKKVSTEQKQYETAEVRKILKPISKLQFDLNQADTIELKKLRGIGDKLAVRIIRYREALGGFTSMQQLSEIYRLDTTVIKEMKLSCFIVNNFEPRKIDLNNADEKTLANHPYLSPREANVIVTYRFKHGEFKSVEDLYNINALDPNSIKRIIPYLIVLN